MTAVTLARVEFASERSRSPENSACSKSFAETDPRYAPDDRLFRKLLRLYLAGLTAFSVLAQISSLGDAKQAGEHLWAAESAQVGNHRYR